MEMLEIVENRLLASGHLSWPSVYLSGSLEGKFQARLREIVKSHRGKVVTSPHKATHIIEPKQEGDPDEDPDLEYLRTIDHRDRMNLVHWWYYPDSYDTWLPATDVQGEQPDPDPPHHGVWRVSPRFLTDLELFNEWMNELDYEIEAEEQGSEVSNAMVLLVQWVVVVSALWGHARGKVKDVECRGSPFVAGERIQKNKGVNRKDEGNGDADAMEGDDLVSDTGNKRTSI